MFRRLSYTTTKDPLKIKEFPVPSIKSNEMLVKVHSAALNPIDLLLYHSAWLFFYKRQRKGFGRDFSGIIESVGDEIKEYKAGDKISGLFEPIFTEQGTVSQYLVVNPKTSTFGKIPENVSLEEAASFPLVFSTALNTLRKFHIPTTTSRVLVIGGATSVGSYTIQLLKNYYDAGSIISVNSGSSAPLVKKLGADYVVDYTKGKVASQIQAIVKDKFDGERLDLIVDCVGGGDLFPIMDEVLKPKSTKTGAGYVTLVGDTIADYNSSLLSFVTFSNFKKLLPFLRNYNYSFVSTSKDFYPVAKELFEKGQLETYVDSVFGLDEYQVALKKLSTHKAKGKIIINMN